MPRFQGVAGYVISDKTVYVGFLSWKNQPLDHTHWNLFWHR